MTAVLKETEAAAATDVQSRVEALAEYFAANGRANEDAGRLTDEVASRLKDTGLVRMLQPKRFGGMESHPVDFMKAVLATGSADAATGWVAGVVGVHPHELAQADLRLQEELWGQDQDTWIASPYAPMGVGRPVEGGYIFNGHWKFSSGTDHCQWVMIGGFVANPDGTPNRGDVRHFCLPRADYEILQDSWEVMGLKGTGSKDLVVKDVFVPDYRVISQDEIVAGTAARALGLDNPLYSIPRGVMFSGAIVTGTLAIAQGALGAALAFNSKRVQMGGRQSSTDTFQLQAVGKAAADIQSSIYHVLGDFERVYDYAATGKTVPVEMRLEVRRNQVRATHRALAAVDDLFLHAGGGSLHLDQPLQRFWRDMHAGMNHIVNVAEPWYSNWSLDYFGHDLPAGTKL
ncbi:acyl-CoA dehydrogenase family protein [Arthrobacter ginkgonis]|uniref:Acyl-CoA dehydrogenase family protein n=1 Tax=Arthrobacter ginkgonis TaxID=1630594 RepID=A0ABP7CAM9_9MICC